MRTKFFYFLALVTVLCLHMVCFHTMAYGQNQVKIMVQINPPYSPYLGDYTGNNKIVVNLQNSTTTTYKLKLIGKITGDNGIEISTNPNYTPPTPIVLGPNQFLPIFSNDISKYLDPNNLNFKGITKQSLITGQALPEGTYTFCFRAVDYVTGQPLSPQDPQGCSTPINLTYIEPPILLKPECNSSIPASNPQVVTFSWSQPGVPFTTLQYQLTVKEVPAGVNAQQVIQNQAYPALAQLTTNAALSTIYGPTSPLLVPGKQYVYRLHVADLNQKQQFKNNGYSEACVFTMTAPVATDTMVHFVLTAPTNEKHFNPDSVTKNGFRFDWQAPSPYNIANGPLTYGIKVVRVEAGQTFVDALKKNPSLIDKGFSNGSTMSNTFLLLGNDAPLKEKNTYAWQVIAFSKGKELIRSEIREFFIDSDKTPSAKPIGPGTIKGIVQYAFADPFGSEGLQLYPLATQVVTLVRRDYVGSGKNRVFVAHADSTIATATTGANGSFSFTFKEPTLMHRSQKTKAGIEIGRGYFLRVSNPHYTSPDEELLFHHDSTTDAGNLRSLARSMRLRVTVQDVRAPYIMNAATVYILRTKPVSGVPSNEVAPRPNPPENFFGAEILGKATTNASGYAEFSRIMESYGSEQYVILVVPPDVKSGYKFPATFYPSQTKPAQSSKGQLTSEYVWTYDHIEIEPSSIETGVQGTLTGGFANAMHPLKKVGVKLQVRYRNGGILPADFAPNSYPDNGKIIGWGTTDNNGNFSLTTDYVSTSLQSGVFFRLLVDDPHYTGPDKDIVLQLGGTTKLGNVQANVRKYNLDLVYKKDDTKQPAAGLRVYLLRKTRPATVPPEEGSPNPSTNKKMLDMEVIAETTTDGSGAAHFTDLVQHAKQNDINFVYAESDPFAPTSSGKQERYQVFFPALEDWYNKDDHADFNDQYVTPTHTLGDLRVFPLPPKIAGRVVRSDNDTAGIANAQVILPDISAAHPDAVVMTDQYGYFEFSEKISALGAQKLAAGHEGYEQTTMALPKLKTGEQWYKLVKLDPSGVVSGTITYGAVYQGQTYGGDVKVQLGDGIAKYVSGYFELPAPTSVQQKLTIQPQNPAYLDDSVIVTPHSGNTSVGTIQLAGNRHRMHIQVYDEVTKKQISTYDIMAKVDDVDISNYYPDYSHGKGDMISQLEFTAPPGKNTFTISLRCDPQGNNSYEQRKITLTNKPSKDFQNYTLYTRAASSIYGHVYLYSKKQNVKVPVIGAHIWKNETSTMEKLEAYSSANGEYRLKNVPIGSNTVSAGKAKSGTIGTTATLNVGNNPLNYDIILKEYEDMDITHLLGFPMEVTELDSTLSGVFISGSLLDLPSNAEFTAKAYNEVDFNNIQIKPHGTLKNANGRALAKPATLPMKSTEQMLGVTVGKKTAYNGELRPFNKPLLTVTSNSDTSSGEIRGKVFINGGQFTNSLGFPLDGQSTGFYLGADNTGSELLALSADSAKVIASKLYIGDKQGKALNYKLYKFDAVADPTMSFLYNDSLRLNSKIKIMLSNVQQNPEVDLPVGEIIPIPSGIKINSPSGSFPSIPLDKWTLVGDQWSLKDFSLKINGTLKTGVVDIPFTDLYVNSNGWDVATAKFQQAALSINNVVPITSSGTTQFNYNPTAKYWELTIVPQPGKEAATFKLPDVSQDILKIKSLDFYSSGYSNFDLVTGQSMTLHKVALFKPSVVTANSAKPEVTITGTTDIGIPNAGVYGNNALLVQKQNGVPTVSFSQFYKPIVMLNVKGVNVSLPANQQTLASNGFTAIGTAKDFHSPSTFSFPITLRKTTDSTNIAINTNDPTAIFPIDKQGTQKLTNVTGAMHVLNNNWDTLRFAGDITGSEGASGRLSFVARGAIETDGSQKISASNISTPFGNLNVTYDFSLSRLKGSIDFDNDVGAAHLSGAADFLVDKSGWLVAAYGHVDLTSPDISIQCAMALGGYKAAGAQQELLSKFAKMVWDPSVPDNVRGYPADYYDLKGFYFVGDATNFLGYELPNFNVDLDPVAHADLSATYGIALALGMNFANGAQLDIKGAGYFRVHASFGASIGLACMGGDMDAWVNLYGNGSVNFSSKKWTVNGGADLVMNGSLYVGGGACDSDCDGWFCFTHSFSGSLHYSLVKFNVGSDGFKLAF